MSRDYTMEDFHAEMRRRGVRKDGPQITAPAATQVPDGAVTRIVRCGVHPMHFVRISASGARSGCPMCEAARR
jgi:hypothetical protein